MDAQRVYVDYLYVNKSILAEFTDVRFGKIISRRAELQKALGLCQQQGATLLVAKIDRLIRNIEQALPLYRELDGRLESCDIPSLDKFTLALFMVIAD